jgi:hypothetical protein
MSSFSVLYSIIYPSLTLGCLTNWHYPKSLPSLRFPLTNQTSNSHISTLICCYMPFKTFQVADNSSRATNGLNTIRQPCGRHRDATVDPCRDRHSFRKGLQMSASSLWRSVYTNKWCRSAKSDEGCVQGAVRSLSLVEDRLRVPKNFYVGLLTDQVRPARPFIAYCARQAGWHNGSAVDCGDIFKRCTICISATVQFNTLFSRIYGWNSSFK